MDFTHLDARGNAVMVDISEKSATIRQAIAKGRIKMSRKCFENIQQGRAKKGDVLGTARVAGIMAAKRTAELIPLCHVINITKASIDFELLEESHEVEAICTVKTIGQTGVEMEALTGVSVALLTIYDMCKAVDKSMEIRCIYLAEKTGGKSGPIRNEK